MLVLLGPGFEGTADLYDRLARATGLVAYDLRARLRPGHLSLVRTLADAVQAEALARTLAEAGLQPVLVDPAVAHDPERRIVSVRDFTLGDRGFVATMPDREMPIEYAAVACIVRGEVQPGRLTQRSSSSSASFRAVAPAEPPSVRDVQPSPFEAYQAADVHFLSVPWILRVDVRSLGSVAGESGVRALDVLSDDLARRSSARVDRGIRISSVATFAEQTHSMRNPSAEPLSRRDQADERFDPYSRLIGEAERRVRTTQGA